MKLSRIHDTEYFTITTPAINQSPAPANNNNQSSGEDYDKLKLYGHPLSPFVRNVWSYMSGINGIKCEYDPTLPVRHLRLLDLKVPDGLTQAGLDGKVPAMEFWKQGKLVKAICDSTVINEELSRKYPENPYIVKEHSEALEFQKYANTRMMEIFYRIFAEKLAKKVVYDRNPKVIDEKNRNFELTNNKPLFNKDPDQKALAELMKQVPEIIKHLNQTLVTNNKKFLVSDTLSIGDIAVIHHFVGLIYAKEDLQEEPYNLKAFPKLAQYVQDGLAEPAIKDVLEKAEEVRAVIDHPAV